MMIDGIDTMQSNFGRVLFPIKENTGFEDGIQKCTKLILTNTIDETSTNFEKLSLTIPNNDTINYTNNYYNVITPPIICVNKSNIDGNNTSSNHTNVSFVKTKMSTVGTKINNKKNVEKIVNKKQQNLSFSNGKLWEINRVNQILHKKISIGVKPTYLRLNPSKPCVKATSKINREIKNKDIIKRNEVSFI